MIRSIGKRLKELRKLHKLTLKEVGDYLGVSATAISCYESGTRKPSATTIHKLAEYYHTSTDDILQMEHDEHIDLKIFLSQSNLLWDGIPIEENELHFIRYFLEMNVKHKYAKNEQ